ncbi:MULTISPECIES: HD domain-containing phosphohydrolase [unclassified Variovorax]|uniref:HD domain-containing phosphohydrolase n=1 Tax=unclassified Variovorax TaxID=663243 RepID=UPI000F7D5B21|nr:MULTISPECIES: HD domain-containing phosphohydrolase [unclassified Variovorax]RSZ39710.1 LuxR family transcriptional regulator [Variovorax sp. 553]RSZ40584.1 LuxR family transcriptional regulator [Variovorax sp. 679]
MQPSSPIRVFDAIRALAFVGDLSMGQPIDHSVRTGWLASRLASVTGCDAATQSHVVCVALLRWSGCTANAPEFSDLLGDDVGGRRTMLSTASARAAADFASSVSPLAEIHCEVSGDIARTLGMPAAVELPLRHIFETFDGTGKPDGLDASRIPLEVFLVSIAGDLEIFSRVHGLSNALRYIAERADARYPAFLVDAVRQHAVDWLHMLEQGAAAEPQPPSAALQDATAPLELIADVIDLKLPWMTGYSRKVAEAALRCAAGMGLSDDQQQRIYRAGLIHGIGRASVPNAVWDSPQVRSEADAERLRLVPYWTERAARRIEPLRAEAEIASFVDERLDGSGFFRGAKGPAIDTEARVLAVAAHWVALCTSRPGRPALAQAEALAALRAEGDAGRLDPQAVAALTGQPQAGVTSQQPSGEAAALLSSREVEVLGRISLGESNKEAARSLGISPSTVRAHLENIFRKLGCTTRAAATLKALTLGLL